MAGWRVSGGRAPSGWEWNGSQPGQGATELGFPRPALGKMQSEAARRAGEPSGIEKKRRRRVLVVTTCSPRPMRTVQRVRLCAITWTASQAPLAAKRPEGRWLRPTPYFRSRMAFSISAWRRWSASEGRWLRPTPYFRSRMAFSISAWRRWSASVPASPRPGR